MLECDAKEALEIIFATAGIKEKIIESFRRW
jgi:hypothetical protein